MEQESNLHLLTFQIKTWFNITQKWNCFP